MPNEKINNTDEFDLFMVWGLENGDSTFFTILYKIKNSEDYVLSNAFCNKIIKIFNTYKSAEAFLHEEGYSHIDESASVSEIKNKYTLLDKEKRVNWRKQQIIDEYMEKRIRH